MTQTRRGFLQQGWNWILLAAITALCYPLTRFLKFSVPRKPRLVKVDKLLTAGSVHLDPDFILFFEESGPWALSRTCTHLGCRLNYSEEEKLLICPCHQSKFTREGKRIAGPAQRDLTSFPVEKMSDDKGSGYIVTL